MTFDSITADWIGPPPPAPTPPPSSSAGRLPSTTPCSVTARGTHCLQSPLLTSLLPLPPLMYPSTSPIPRSSSILLPFIHLCLSLSSPAATLSSLHTNHPACLLDFFLSSLYDISPLLIHPYLSLTTSSCLPPHHLPLYKCMWTCMNVSYQRRGQPPTTICGCFPQHIWCLAAKICSRSATGALQRLNY